MNELDLIKLNIYEAYDNDEITEAEKEYLLEKVDLVKAAKTADSTIGKGTETLGKGVNDVAFKVANKISPNDRHRRNQIATGIKGLGTAATLGTITAIPWGAPINAYMYKKVNDGEIANSKNKKVSHENRALSKLAVQKTKKVTNKIDDVKKKIDNELSTRGIENSDPANPKMYKLQAMGLLSESTELDLIKLNIYEAYESGEITYGEKEYLLEQVNNIDYLSEDGDMLDTVLAHPKIKLRNKAAETTNNIINKASTSLYNKIPNTPKTHKLRNRIAIASKLAGTAGAVGAYKVSPLPGTDFYALSLANSIKSSKHPIDRTITKNASDLKKGINKKIENEKELMRKADKDKSPLNTALKNYSHLGFTPENTEED